MQGKEDIDKGNKRALSSVLLSAAAHAAVLFSAGIISLPSLYIDPETRYLEVKVVSSDFNNTPPPAEEQTTPEESEGKNNPEAEESNKDNEVKESIQRINELEFSSAAADTSSLSQVYKESSFDISMKYPAGWTYLDQHLESKLEGVVFWPSSADISPPPYIHLETADKEYFYPEKFKKKFICRNKEYYYNDPVKIGGEWQQSVYVRTRTSSDFVIKVIIKGDENFHKFLPSFYAIVKSFDFSNNLL